VVEVMVANSEELSVECLVAGLEVHLDYKTVEKLVELLEHSMVELLVYKTVIPMVEMLG